MKRRIGPGSSQFINIVIALLGVAILVMIGVQFWPSTVGEKVGQGKTNPVRDRGLAGDGNLAGDVFVIMQSGDVKRGADVEVVLVAATDQFESNWRDTIDGFRNEYAEAASTFDEALAGERQEMEKANQEVEACLRKTPGRCSDELRELQKSFEKRTTERDVAFARLRRIRAEYVIRAKT